MAVDTPGDRLLLSPTRRAVLELLEAPAGGLTARQVATDLGLHVTTARFHLEQLVSAGLVTTAQRRGSVGRPRKLYLDARGGSAGLATPRALRAFTELLTSAFAAVTSGSPVDPEAAGRHWVAQHSHLSPAAPAKTPGAWLGKVGQAVDLLEEWGYQPELRTAAGGRTVELTLHDCPFMPMARAHPEVVCGIHRGLVGGTLAAVGEQDADLELVPFVTERTCVARLTSPSVAARGTRRDG